MKTPLRIVLLSALVVTTANAGDKPADLVKYRQQIMKAMGAHMSAISLISKGQVADRGQVAAHAEAIRALSHELPDLFPADSGPDKTRTAAMKEIWQRWNDFKSIAAKLEKSSAALAAEKRAGASRNAAFDAVGAQCNACHKEFRQKDQD